MAKLGLGKGLGALLDDTQYDATVMDTNDQSADRPGKSSSKASPPKQEDFFVDVSLLKPNPYQPRRDFDKESLQNLADSILEHGVIQPIIVEEAGDGTYYIIAGERRTRAAQIAGLKKIPVRVQKFDDNKKLEVALIENIQREDLNPIEEAKAYRQLMEMSHLNQDEVAKRVGKNRSTVANALRLLKLPQDMLSALANGQLTPGHARALLSVVNPADQRILFARILGTGMSVRDAEQYSAELNTGGRPSAPQGKKNAKNATAKSRDIASLEEQFMEALGTKTVIQGSLDRGSIKIDFFSREDLDRLYDLIIKA